MSNPKPLDDLLGEAKSHAEFSMRHAGSVPPTMFAMTAEGLLQFLPTRFDARSYAAFSIRNISRVAPMLLALSEEGEARVLPATFGDAQSREKFDNICRTICETYGATAVVTILESRVKLEGEGTPPSETFDRGQLFKAVGARKSPDASDLKEFVILAGEATGTKTQVFLPIVRTGAGGFFGFGEFDSSRFAGFHGRFSEMLPPQKPDKEMRKVAQAALKAMGVTRVSLQPKPGRN